MPYKTFFECDDSFVLLLKKVPWPFKKLVSFSIFLCTLILNPKKKNGKSELAQRKRWAHNPKVS